MKKIALLLALALLFAASLIGTPQHVYSQTESGQVALTGHDGNIYIYDVATQTLTPLTSDGDVRSRVYNWPTWSTDGQLAYFGTGLSQEDPYSLGIFIQLANGKQKRVFQSTEEIFTYAYWSPADCPDGNCRDLAVLYTNGRGELALRAIRVANDFTILELSSGGPHYWDWSPDGQAMFWARYGRDLEIYDVTSDEVVTAFAESQGFQRAVDWSPVDNRLLAAVTADNRTSSLVILDGDQIQIVAEELTGGVAFEWSPDGSQIAYLNEDTGTLALVSSASGSVSQTIEDGVIAFFWSPDGTQIAYLRVIERSAGVSAKPTGQESQFLLQWSVYEVQQQQSTVLSSFLPTRNMVYYLTFFDQFARSHRLWSPDSRYLVYADVPEEGVPQVILLDVTTQTTKIIADGTLGIFSWN